MAVLTRDPAPDSNRDCHVGGAPAAHALPPIVHIDFVDSTDRPRAHPADVFDLRVGHVARAVTPTRVIDTCPRGSRRSLEAQSVAKRARDVQVDVGPGVPGDGDLHEAGPVPAAIVDDSIAIVVEGVAPLFDGIRAIARDLLGRRNRDDRYQRGRLDDARRFVGVGNLASSLARRSVGASAGAGEQQHQTGDRYSSRHPAGTIAEVAYNAGAMMEALTQAKEAVADRTGKVDVAMVLGSGLGDYVNGLEDATKIPYGEIPHMPLSGVQGHAGNLVTGRKAGKRVVAMQGRAHLYEGNSPKEVAFGVRLMAILGADTLIVTNAAGGIGSGLEPGALMAITDQLNLTGVSSLVGPNDAQQGPRFLDMSAAFDPALIDVASAVATEQGFSLERGIYAGLLGPSYETPAEVRMLRTLGADAVGMSTVLEVLAARHMGLRVLGISCISNLAAGISPTPLSHEEVQETASRARPRFEALLSGVLESM